MSILESILFRQCQFTLSENSSIFLSDMLFKLSAIAIDFIYTVKIAGFYYCK